MTHSEMLVPWEEQVRRLLARRKSAVPVDHDSEDEYRHITTDTFTTDLERQPR